jgi:hypothetical protein
MAITITPAIQQKTFCFQHSYKTWNRKDTIKVPAGFAAILEQNGKRNMYNNTTTGDVEISLKDKAFKDIKLKFFGTTDNIQLYFVKNILTYKDGIVVDNYKSRRKDEKVKYIVVSGKFAIKATVTNPLATLSYLIDECKFTKDSNCNVLTTYDVVEIALGSALTIQANAGSYLYKPGVSLAGALTRDAITNIMWVDEVTAALGRCFQNSKSLGLKVTGTDLNFDKFSTTYY